MIDSRVVSHPSVLKRNIGMTAVLMAVAVLCSGCGYNTMVSLKEQIDSAWAQVENQLQRRNDLIPNLVEVTKGYAAHEKEIFTRVAEARSRLIGAGSRAEKIDAADNLSGALSRLLAIAENYPQLKADAQFARLSDELAGTENRIATERRRYNDTVREYNTFIKKFPQTLIARLTGFETEKYFEAAKGAEEVPKVDFK
jgi:LemA protein